MLVPPSPILLHAILVCICIGGGDRSRYILLFFLMLSQHLYRRRGQVQVYPPILLHAILVSVYEEGIGPGIFSYSPSCYPSIYIGGGDRSRYILLFSFMLSQYLYRRRGQFQVYSPFLLHAILVSVQEEGIGPGIFSYPPSCYPSICIGGGNRSRYIFLSSFMLSQFVFVFQKV